MAKTRKNIEDGWKLPEGTRARIRGLAKMRGMDDGHGPAILFRLLFEHGYQTFLRRMVAAADLFEIEHEARFPKDRFPSLGQPDQVDKDFWAAGVALQTMQDELQTLQGNAEEQENPDTSERNPPETGGDRV